jgi:hypothetical protein
MGPPLPPKALGIRLGSQVAKVSLSCFIDLCCPFSKKIFVRLSEVHKWSETKYPGAFSINFLLTPQPWHPQSPILTESVLAVQKVNDNDTVALSYINKLFDQIEDFYDDSAYSKSRVELHQELASVAAEFVDRETFLKILAYKVVEGSRNTGNETTQDLKWLVKYHRSQGVHVTPTCFINNIEASQISSGWELNQWQELLEPMCQ